ncbi:cupin domain-containing protein [Olleya aquimaris]|uniref:Cupin domain-containing protein n=1 Tax=Olleya aquimaris TaxID=639310 RepID=A0A327RHP4_9FLAO|nr:cupin domain-containing protein [Olleya aquimaris]RAJ15054.1 Cupin domain-containing protein [Olleya aquimaris]
MYLTNNILNQTPYEGLKAKKILDIEAKEMLHISLEANAVFPKHSSPRDAYLLVLEGKIIFTINNTDYTLLKHQIFSFPKDKDHWVKAIQNSKFLIIR